MSASDDNVPQGAPRPPDHSSATPPDDTLPRTLRSPQPPPPRMPGIVPMPELSQAGTHTAPSAPLMPALSPQPAAPATEDPARGASSTSDLPPLSPLAAPATSLLSPQGAGPWVRTPIAGYGQQVERGAWQRRDKVEPNDSVEDEELISLEGNDGWAIVGASRIGRGHLHDGKYREDGFAAAITADGWHLVAVADGGGSYRLARVGAPQAARTAVAAMRAALAEREEGTAAGAEGEIEARARGALVAGLRTARQAIYDEAERRRAAGDQAVTADDLRSTLLLVLHRSLPIGGQLIAGAQVGDGLIAARAGAEGALYVLGAPETGGIGNETMFLPDVPDAMAEWERRVRFARLDGAEVYLLVLSDGVSDDFAPAAEHLWRLERPLFAAVLVPSHMPVEAVAALRDLLGYERAGSFDDRTVVCIYRRSAVP